MVVLACNAGLGTECACRLDEGGVPGYFGDRAGGPGRSGGEEGGDDGGASGDEPLLQDVLESGLIEHGAGPQLQAARGGALEEASKGQHERQGEGSACGGQDGAAGDQGGDCSTPEGGAILHGESGGVAVEATVHDQVGQ